MALDRIQARRQQSAPQFIAMGADFLPESLALGGIFAAGGEGAVLLALLIGLQNLPEGYNAWRELAMARVRPRKVLGLMLMLAILGPVCGVIGWFWLVNHDQILGGIMLFAAGGILYLTFQDIATAIETGTALGATPGCSVRVCAGFGGVACFVACS